MLAGKEGELVNGKLDIRMLG
ncbi:Protein of unknown function [Bacillus mycoides]|nr:Protein of unknown function [Bacillus mycoides]